MERKYLQKLNDWLVDPLRKPLIIYGARQVGKTYLVKELFAKKYFKEFVYVDFKKDIETRIFVKNHVSAKEIIDYLSLKLNISIDKNVLIIFDEVQECLPCLTSLKYFCEDYREIPVIATGSMVRTKLRLMERNSKGLLLDKEIQDSNQDGNNNYMSPTGKVNIMNMYPLSFDEYLLVRNKKLYEFTSQSFKERKVLDDSYHSLLLQMLNEYLLIGGMPESIDVFLKTKSFLESTKTVSTLFSNYLGDIPLYQMSNESILRTRIVYNNLYKQLNKDNKNFKISLLEKDKKYRDYEYAIEWLRIGRLIYKSNQLKQTVTLPLKEDADSLFRLYFSDLGFFSLQSGVDKTNFIDSLKSNTLAGIFYENLIAEELSSRNIPLFFWKGKTSSELEFVINLNGEAVAIDAKKNKGDLSSLEKYRDLNKKCLAIKVSANKYGYSEEQKLLTLPYYYFPFFLDENIDKIQQIISND